MNFPKLACTAICALTISIAATRLQAQETAIDPQMKAVLDELAELNPKPIDTLSAEEARKQATPTDAVLALLKKQDKSRKPLPVADVEDTSFDGPAGSVPVRVYTPAGDGPFPVLLYFHGGGFVIATIDTYDASCRALCDNAKCVVVSVEYRKAPESKYPAATDDALASYKWICENAGKFKGDPNRIAIGGESAGGNLATVTCIRAREASIPLPIFQLLIYPVVNNEQTTESYQRYADARPLNKAMMGWFFKQYLSDVNSATDPHVTPMNADVSGLPPAMVITAEIDPLMTEGKMYADKLKEAGVVVEYKNYTGVAHEFFGMGAVVNKAQAAQMDAANSLRRAFEGKPTSGLTATPQDK